MKVLSMQSTAVARRVFVLSCTWLAMLGLAAAVDIMSWALNRATGERHHNLISESQEIAMGRQPDSQVFASIGLYPNNDLQRYILANMTIDMNGIDAVGYGATLPIANNETPEGRAKNRRVDLVIEPIL